MEINTLSDPARFAQAIRGLARDAHRTLTHSPSSAALRGLSRRIEHLSSALGDRRGGPVATWLNNLGREVRSAAVHRAESPAPEGRWSIARGAGPWDERMRQSIVLYFSPGGTTVTSSCHQLPAPLRGSGDSLGGDRVIQGLTPAGY
jgi:hypothetical protein